MRFLALDLDDVAAAALDRGNDADGFALVFQPRALLDMGLDIAIDGEARLAVTQRRRCPFKVSASASFSTTPFQSFTLSMSSSCCGRRNTARNPWRRAGSASLPRWSTRRRRPALGL